MTKTYPFYHSLNCSPPFERSPNELAPFIITVLFGCVIAARTGARLGADIGNDGGPAGEVLGAISGALLGTVIGGVATVIAAETISVLMDDPLFQ